MKYENQYHSADSASLESLASVFQAANNPAHIDPEQIADYLSGTLLEADRVPVERHLAFCPFCISLVADLGAYVELPSEAMAAKASQRNETIAAKTAVEAMGRVVDRAREVASHLAAAATGAATDLAAAIAVAGQGGQSLPLPALAATESADAYHSPESSASSPTEHHGSDLALNDHPALNEHPVVDMFSWDSMFNQWDGGADAHSDDGGGSHHSHHDS